MIGIEREMASISAELKHFLDTAIESVEQLEVLRLLAADPAKEWSASELARSVQTTAQRVQLHVADLESQGLLRVRRGIGLLCQYMPATPKSDDLVSRLLDVYNERPVTLIRMITDRSARERR